MKLSRLGTGCLIQSVVGITSIFIVSVVSSAILATARIKTWAFAGNGFSSPVILANKRQLYLQSNTIGNIFIKIYSYFL